MKTFKKSLAVILAVLMMLSMMIVGGVSTNAAEYGTDSVTFKAGETIYYDLTQYGSGCNVYDAAGNEKGDWKPNTGSIIAVKLTKDLTITANSNLFYSGANGWDNGVTAAVPTEGQNMIVSTDGKTAYWDTYVEPEKVESTVYFKNTVGWANVYFYGGVYWDSSKGSGSDGIAVGPVAMTKVDGTDDVYTCTVNAPAFTNVAFTKDSQSGYGNFWKTEAAYSADFNAATPLFTPDSSDTSSLNSTTYYGGAWSTYTPSSESTTASTQATTASSEPASEPSSEPASQPSSEPVEKTTVYFVNSGKWTTINAHIWVDGGENLAPWPGTAMTATGEKAGNGADIYSIEFDSKFNRVIFTNKNTGSVQTDTLTPENGKYYDYNTNKWYDDPAEIVATGDVVTLAGTMNGWSTSKTPFVDGSVSVDLDAEKTYEFKIMINGTWHGNNGTMTADNCTGWTFKSDDGNNCKITTTIAGTYTFNFDSNTKKLSVVYPTEPAKTDYTVVFNYKTEDGTQTLTKTTTTAETDISAIANSVMPNIENKMYSYALGECTADGTTITANLVETKKLYSVTVDGAIMETQFGYKDKATVTLKDGTEYTFYVTGDVEITSNDPKVAAALSLDAVTVTDTKVSMDLLATANVEKFARMGVAFATADMSSEDIAAAVTNVTTGTAVSNGIAVHNSTVDTPNESGSYQFTYAPYVSKDKANKTLFFYTFAVDTDGNVSVSSVVSVDLANVVA